VAGDVTTLTVRITNTGDAPTSINVIGLAGNFSSTGTPVCDTEGPGKVQPLSSASSNIANVDPSTTTTQTGSSTTAQHCDLPDHDEEVVFFPVIPATSTTTTPTTSTSSHSTTTTTTSTATVSQTCSTGAMSLADGNREERNDGGLNLNPGQCIDLTFTGKISFGDFVFVPSTAVGQTYMLHIFASNGADEEHGCTMAQGHDSCD